MSFKCPGLGIAHPNTNHQVSVGYALHIFFYETMFYPGRGRVPSATPPPLMHGPLVVVVRPILS